MYWTVITLTSLLINFWQRHQPLCHSYILAFMIASAKNKGSLQHISEWHIGYRCQQRFHQGLWTNFPRATSQSRHNEIEPYDDNFICKICLYPSNCQLEFSILTPHWAALITNMNHPVSTTVINSVLYLKFGPWLTPGPCLGHRWLVVMDWIISLPALPHCTDHIPSSSP